MPKVEIEYNQDLINKYYSNLWNYIEARIREVLKAQNIKITYEKLGNLELKDLAKRLDKKGMKLAVAIFTGEPKDDLKGNTKITKRVFVNLIDVKNDIQWYIDKVKEWNPDLPQHGTWEVQIYEK